MNPIFKQALKGFEPKTAKLITPPKYSLEIPWDGEAPSSGAWRNYDGIQAEGDTLDELLADAQVALMDQDGGNCGFVCADSDEMQEAIREAFHKECKRLEDCHDEPMTDADREYYEDIERRNKATGNT